jgi:anaerobic selenocysteine-containing dehydrogenase
VLKLTRREFIKTSAVATGFAALAHFTFGDSLGTLISKSQLSSSETNEEWVPTTCWVGKQDCGMLVRRVNGRIVKLEGHPNHPRNRGTLCPKGQGQIMAFYDPYRIKAPLKRTNEKGVPGKWQEISWDEALTTVGNKIKEIRTINPKLILWQKGRSKAKKFYDNAFVKACGALKLGHGAYCSDVGYRALEYTIGFHGVLHPDFKHCNYLINWGWNALNAGGNKLCWITWTQQFIEARERGMKVVTLDPRKWGVAHHTDEWYPIKPGTDLAFFLALANVLIANGYIDEEYLKKYTNSPFLVKEDGYFLRDDEGKEQVWDKVSAKNVPYDTEGIDPALEGEFTVNGQTVKPAFQVFKEHVAQYTPEWAANICDISAETIRSIALELGENAKIGSTIVIDGVELPYRPVAIMGYHVTQQELGFQACRAAVIVFMLLGAIEAVGGVRSDFSRKIHKNFKKLDEIEIKDPPYDITLDKSKFFPINTKNPSVIMEAMLNPEKYEVDPNTIPKMLILHMVNPVLSFPPQDVFMKAYKKFEFVVAIEPWMSETADYFADIILPAATIEKYEGPISATDQYEDAVTLRLPPMTPLFNSKGEIDIYMELCEKAGILYGEGGYIDHVNKQLKLKDPYKLDINKKPTVREIFDNWAKSQGIEEGISYFEKNGVKVKGSISVNELYAPAWGDDLGGPYGGIRHRLYGESLKRYQDTMKQKGVEEIYYRLYDPLPTWKTPTLEGSPSEYDLYLISAKKIEFKQSRSTFFPLLNELEPQQYLEINPEKAKAKGIKEGEDVWVESYNAVTGETRKIRARVKYVEGIRPDTVFMAHHYGFWVHPKAQGGGPTPNVLFFTGKGYVACTADQSFHVKVRVYKG